MQTQVWYAVCHQVQHETVLASLHRHGVTCGKLDAESPGRTGIVFFAHADQALLDVLARYSRGRANRILALNLGSIALENSSSWGLLAAGAADVIEWRDEAQCAQQVAARLRHWSDVDILLDSPLVRENLLGGTPAWRAALRQVVESARYGDGTLLIMGETGTGKELAARLAHTLDARAAKGALVVLDCTTIVPELAGSELFGHERGAFTGAVAARDGAFALANGGSLFLDEIGELPLPLQAQLLRVIQERTYKRVGGNRWLPSDFRLICATHRDLAGEVAQGRFRSDLYYRIATHVCTLPPLRERLEDVEALAAHFLGELRLGEPVPPLSKPVRDYLLQRDYPGNVRELRQLVHRIGARHVGAGPVTVGAIPEDERPAVDSAGAGWRSAEFERAVSRALHLGAGLKELSQYAAEIAIRVAVESEAGNLQRAARKLGVTDRALQMRRALSRAPSRHH